MQEGAVHHEGRDRELPPTAFLVVEDVELFHADHFAGLVTLLRFFDEIGGPGPWQQGVGAAEILDELADPPVAVADVELLHLAPFFTSRAAVDEEVLVRVVGRERLARLELEQPVERKLVVEFGQERRVGPEYETRPAAGSGVRTQAGVIEARYGVEAELRPASDALRVGPCGR